MKYILRIVVSITLSISSMIIVFSSTANNDIDRPKPAVIQIAEEVNNDGQGATSEGLMEFSLTPSTNVTSSSMHDMTNMAGM